MVPPAEPPTHAMVIISYGLHAANRNASNMDVLKTVLEAILNVVAGSDLPDPSQRQFVAKKELSERDATVSVRCDDVTPNSTKRGEEM